MKPSPASEIPRTRRSSCILSVTLVLVVLCRVAAGQPSAEQPLVSEEAAAVAPSAEFVFPQVTDPAELRRLAASLREAAESPAMNLMVDEQERRKLLERIVKGEALPTDQRIPYEKETNTRHENSLHCLALAESFTREAELREQIIQRREEIQAAEEAGEVKKARELSEQAERLLESVHNAPENRTWRERTFSQTKEVRNRLRQLEIQASSLRRESQYVEAENVDREIRSHLRTPLSLDAVAVVNSYAEEPITFRYPLQHARAGELLATLRKLGNTLHHWIVDDRTNTIIAQGPRFEVYQMSQSIAELDQPTRESAPPPAAGDAAVHDGVNQVHTTTQQLPTVLGQAMEGAQSALAQQEPVERIQIYHVQHVSPAEVIDVLRQLFGKAGHAVGDRIVLAALDSEHAEIKRLLAQIDVADGPGESAAPANPVRGEQPSPNPPGSGIDEDHIEVSLAALRQAYAAAEEEAAKLKAKFKASAKPIPADNALRIQLRAAVAKAFEARQMLLRAELIEFRQRMDRLQQTINQRDRIADQIIDRRVEDLLNPYLEWDAPQSSAETTLSDPTAMTADPPPAEVLDRLQGTWSIKKAYAPFERGIAPFDRQGTFQFEEDAVRIVWEEFHKSPRREEAAAQVVVRPASQESGELDIVWSNPDFTTSLKCRYGWINDKLILAMPYDGKDVSVLLPRPEELKPGRNALHLELERLPDRSAPAEIKLSLLVTQKGQPRDNAIVDIFRQTFQPNEQIPRVERLGMTRTDASGHSDISLLGEIWKQEPRSGYLIYISAPNHVVKCVQINAQSALFGSVSVEFGQDKTPAPFVPKQHLAVASRRGVTITASRDNVEGFTVKKEVVGK